MNVHPHPARFLASLALALLALTVPALAQSSSLGSGEIALYTEAGGGDAIVQNGNLTTNVLTHDFDASVREDVGSFSRVGADITLNRAGHYLALYNSQFDRLPGGSNRSEIQSYLTLNGVEQASGWSQGFIRRASGQDETITAGAAVFEAAATDVLQLRSFRTDNNGGGVQRIASATGLQLLKLDDSDMSYARLSLAANTGGPTNATFVKVSYDTDDELDAAFLHDAAGDLTLVDGGKYLVIANTYAQETVERSSLVQRLTLNSVEVAGSKTTVYLRGNQQNSNQGAASIAMIIDANAGQVLSVEGSLDQNRAPCNYIGGRCALTVVKLSDAADYVRLNHTVDQDSNTTAETPLIFANNDQVDAASFAHVASASAVTVLQDGDYLFLSSLYDNNDQVQRAFFHQGWSVNGSGKEVSGRSGRYARNTGGVDQFGNSSGFLASGMVANDTVEMVSSALAATGVNNANQVFLQGVRLSSLFAFNNFGVDLSSTAVDVSEAGPTTATYDMNLRADPTAGTVEVTVTADADTEVGTDGVAFGPTAVFSLTDTTPQTVHVRAIDDATLEGAEIATLTHAVTASGDLVNYPLSTVISDVMVTVADDDFLPVDAVDDVSEIGVSANEDTALTVVSDGGGTTPSLFANDTDGFDNVLSSFDATSTNGATVSVAGDGTFSWDPTGSGSLQALAAGDQIADIFTYTLEDAGGSSDTATVTITVAGVNDVPVLAGDSLDSNNGASAASNLLANDSDVDATDVLTVSNLVDDVSAAGGAVPAVFASDQGATVSISSDGSFTYDPGTSTAILALTAEAQIIETFTYDVTDGLATVQTTVTVTNTGVSAATNDYTTTAADTTVNLDALANDVVRNPGVLGTPTLGAVLEFLADGVGNSDTAWLNTGSATLASIPDPLGQPIDATLNLAPTNPPPGISATYNFAGFEGIVHDGVDVVAYGDSDNVNASVEFVFRPSDQLGNEILWEVGGTTDGASVVLVGDKVVWTCIDNAALIAQAVGQLPPGAVAGGEFVHIVCTINLISGADVAEIYVNGQLAGTGAGINVNTGAVGDLADWCGTDPGGIGRRATDVGGDAGNLGNFGTTDLGVTTDLAGEVSLLRTYNSILTPAEVDANASAVLGTLNAAVVADITDLAGAGVPVVGVAVALPSGATVTLEADGTFTYDPNGAFADLGVGLTARDSFTYSVNPIVTVNVDVAGTNPNPQITIAADQADIDEGSAGSFTVSASLAVSGPVTVNLSYSGAANNPVDYTGGAASVVIPDTGTSAVLNLNALVDDFFEGGGSESLIVTIDSVVGTAVVGATAVAETLINDLDTAPTISIAADAASFAEGSNAEFTVSADKASSGNNTVNLSYSGTTTEGGDFFGHTSLTIPGGSTAESLDLLLLDDAVVEGGEVLTVTIDSVSVGAIGTASDSTNVTDGAGVVVFIADFEGINPVNTPGGTLLNADAPAAANLGTAIGSWANVFTAAAGGDAPGVITEGGADVKGDGVDHSLRLDRPGSGEGYVRAQFDGAIDLRGANTGVVTFDLGTRRTQGNSDAKSTTILGLDDVGNKAFELFVDANNNGATHEQLFHVDSGGVRTALGNVEDFNNSGGYNEDRMTNVRIALTSTGYSVQIDRFPLGPVVTPDTVTGELAYAGNASVVTQIVFHVSGDPDTGINGGIYIDDVKATGAALTSQEAWRVAFFGSADNSGAGADNNDANGNGLSNILDFLYGFNPTGVSSSGNALEVSNPGPAGVITQHGGITFWADPVTGEVFMRYPRRTDHVAAGLDITDQFSRDLVTFENSVEAPVVIGTGVGDDGIEVEAVQIKLPLVLPVSGGKARFGRNTVQINP